MHQTVTPISLHRCLCVYKNQSPFQLDIFCYGTSTSRFILGSPVYTDPKRIQPVEPCISACYGTMYMDRILLISSIIAFISTLDPHKIYQ